MGTSHPHHWQNSFPFLLRPWSIFFLLISLSIIAGMMLPGFFGLQKFTQWAGMYTDSWCRVTAYAENPHTHPQTKSEEITASTVGAPPVYSAPMHNYDSCLMWARTVQCGRVTSGGWKVAWASPVFKGKRYIDPANACDVPLDAHAQWFRSQFP